ncbi:hypothetical protein [Opitutus terrae]|uniref:Uncharacterized protein n=1 Tax=Opitutus terrae (strain DSM 11246 / JCM 15787 / PB90-1) TaxID=452637 RepID=B1ZSL8_OPITP|nr:hypothetical protein [Opitutus terrae]ACB73875.1 hypothetical protein Oter_0585 [Opitutus terrae PB90-1]
MRHRRDWIIGGFLWLCAASLSAAEPSADPLLAAAQHAEEQHHLATALALALQAEPRHPTDAALLQAISRYYSERSEEVTDRAEKERLCRSALAYAQRSTALAPERAVNVLSVAIAAGKLARVSGPRRRIDYARMAHTWATRALQLDPDYALAHHVLGQWHCEVATLNAPTRWLARMMGGLPPASLSEAIAHLRRAVELAPDRPAHHAALGFALLAAGERDAARASLEQALALPSRDAHDTIEQARARQALQPQPP